MLDQDQQSILSKEVSHVYKAAVCLYTKQQVESALDQIATTITKQLHNSNPIFICVVVGGIVTLGNLLPRLDFPLEVDYIHATRYRKTVTGHEVEWRAKPSTCLKGRTIVVVDDILDGGITLQHVVHFCQEQDARAVYTAVLVEKQGTRVSSGLQHPDFCGLIVPNHYVFGYGLDYKGYLRNAPGIFRVTTQCI